MQTLPLSDTRWYRLSPPPFDTVATRLQRMEDAIIERCAADKQALLLLDTEKSLYISDPLLTFDIELRRYSRERKQRLAPFLCLR